MRLLIAEDEVDLAEALTVFFERNQFTVASGGAIPTPKRRYVSLKASSSGT